MQLLLKIIYTTLQPNLVAQLVTILCEFLSNILTLMKHKTHNGLLELFCYTHLEIFLHFGHTSKPFHFIVWLYRTLMNLCSRIEVVSFYSSDN